MEIEDYFVLKRGNGNLLPCAYITITTRIAFIPVFIRSAAVANLHAIKVQLVHFIRMSRQNKGK